MFGIFFFRYNSQRGTAVMENQWVSKANVQQRAGRAGRVQPGESFHLYSQEKFEEMEPFPQAEILRIPLEKVVMDIKVKIEHFCTSGNRENNHFRQLRRMMKI
jgi:HrpA-like RNA helicase